MLRFMYSLLIRRMTKVAAMGRSFSVWVD
jgi:hypothetical protein